jgi:cell wall-associated NlpC family hydrolase
MAVDMGQDRGMAANHPERDSVIRRLSLLTPLVVILTLAACSPKRVLREPSAPVRPAVSETEDATRPSAGRPLGLEAARLARAQIGRPYRWGGASPEQGFDCSGLVHWCYGVLDVDLPRVVSAQVEFGRSVPRQRLQPGDLLFFAIDRREVSHVGLSLGGDRFVHAPRSGRPVRTDSLDDPYWRTRWTGARRVAPE